jgi:hypothetical protein
MKRIVRLTESDLTRIVKRVINEQKEMLPTQKVDLKITEFRVFNSPNEGQAKVKSDSNPSLNRIYQKCNKNEMSNCFDYPSMLQDGSYPPSRFSGDLTLYVNSKKYVCKLNSICKPV